MRVVRLHAVRQVQRYKCQWVPAQRHGNSEAHDAPFQKMVKRRAPDITARTSRGGLGGHIDFPCTFARLNSAAIQELGTASAPAAACTRLTAAYCPSAERTLVTADWTPSHASKGTPAAGLNWEGLSLNVSRPPLVLERACMDPRLKRGRSWRSSDIS